MKRQMWLHALVLCGVLLLAMTSSVSGSPPSPTVWTFKTVDATDDRGQDVNIAISPLDGQTYISYYDATASALMAATYVSFDGNCGGGQWQCVAVDGGPRIATDVGEMNDIAINPLTGYPAIAYYDRTNNRLMYAASTCAGVSCSWTKTVIDTAFLVLTRVGQYPSLKFGSDGVPRVAYRLSNLLAGTPDTLRYAEYIGSGGACGGGAWDCTSVDSGEGFGVSPSLALTSWVTPLNVPYIASYDSTNGNLRYAWYLGNGSGDCGGGDWNCRIIDGGAGDNVGAFPAITLSSGLNSFVAIAYLDNDNGRLKIARTTSTGWPGNCGGGNWQCDPIYNIGGGSSESVGIAIDRIAGGQPLAAFGCPSCSGHSVMTAEYVGLGGNCLTYEWQCLTVASASLTTLHDFSRYIDVALTGESMPTISYYDFDPFISEGDVVVAMKRWPIYLPMAVLSP